MTALLIDFGSTYTKLRAVALEPARMLASAQGPSTVASDVTVGMELAFADLEKRMGPLPDFSYRLACSSAGGGLRMVTVGLVKELTAEAARQAALGAGARLVEAFAYQLTLEDTHRISQLVPDIILLAGGTDGGNTEVILANARALAEAPIECPIIVVGNRVAADNVHTILRNAGNTAMVTENVMPQFGVLNTEPARNAIRQVFIERIVHAKGIDRAQAMVDQVLMPTPAAVLEGARLVADGHDNEDGLGSLLVVDIGGATTDVHSVCAGEPSNEGVITQGLPEPYLKRTVEGDLGMRYNAPSIVDAIGLERVASEAGLSPVRVTELTQHACTNVETLPQNEDECAFEHVLACCAARLAVQRHAGTTETVYTVTGPVTVQRGKDLTEVKTLI
ncbi:MAG: methylaspartate mutase accessory protein GlmL, partial [Gemmatimonadales bacterium]